MPTKRFFVPDDILPNAKPGADRDVRLLQYTNATTQENFDVFLTHHALVYILSGVKQLKVAHNGFDIHPGELLLIPRGEYVMSEYIAGESGFRSFMLFFTKKAAQSLLEQIGQPLPATSALHKEPMKILPPNRLIEQLFITLEAYSQCGTPFMCQLIRLKFAELIYLLLDSSYKSKIMGFLIDAARDDNPTLPSVLESHLYTSASLEELAKLSGRSLSGFKREFATEYGEPPRTWIRKRKLERARFLLETSDQSIEEIVEQTGFVSVPHFTRVFKEQYANTPAAHRTEKRRI